MNYVNAVLLQLPLGDVHLIEVLALRQNCAAQPAKVLSIGGRVDFRGRTRRCECLDLLHHAVLHALEHGAASGEDDVLEQVSVDVPVAARDALEGLSGDTFVLLLDQLRVEEHLRGANEFVPQHKLRIVRECHFLELIRLLGLL